MDNIDVGMGKDLPDLEADFEPVETAAAETETEVVETEVVETEAVETEAVETEAVETEAVETEVAPEPPQQEQGRVPSGVLREAKQKLREAESRAAELQRRLDKQQVTPEEAQEELKIEFNASEQIKNAMEKVLDGDIDLATSQLNETFTNLVDTIQTQVSGVLSKTREQAAADALSQIQTTARTTQIEDAVLDLESKYDILDSKSDNFDEEATNTVLAFQSGLIGMGKNPVDALYEATESVMKLRGISTDPTPEPTPEPPTREAAVARNTSTANAQPARLGGEPNRDNGAGSEIDIYTMPDEELLALPESTLQRLRGDFI